MTPLEEELLTARGAPYQWLYRNFEEIQARFPATKSWTVLARAAKREGCSMSPISLRKAWPRVVRDKQKGQPAKPAPAPSPPLSWGRPTEPGADVTTRPVLRPATVRNPHKDE